MLSFLIFLSLVNFVSCNFYFWRKIEYRIKDEDNLKKWCEAGTKKDPRFMHETIALLQRGKKIECIFLKIYHSERPDLLNCATAYNILNIFKHNNSGYLLFKNITNSNIFLVW